MPAQLFSENGSFVKDLSRSCFFKVAVEILQVTALEIILYQENAHEEILCLHKVSEDKYQISSEDLSRIIEDWVSQQYSDIKAIFEEVSANITVKIDDYSRQIDLERIFLNYKNPKKRIMEVIKKIITSYIE